MSYIQSMSYSEKKPMVNNLKCQCIRTCWYWCELQHSYQVGNSQWHEHCPIDTYVIQKSTLVTTTISSATLATSEYQYVGMLVLHCISQDGCPRWDMKVSLKQVHLSESSFKWLRVGMDVSFQDTKVSSITQNCLRMHKETVDASTDRWIFREKL